MRTRLVSIVGVGCSLGLLMAAHPATAQPSPSSDTVSQVSTPPQEQPAPDLSLGGVFKALAGDFRRLPTRQNLWTVSFGGSLSALGANSDWSATRSMKASPFEEALDPGRVLGGAASQIGAATLTYVAGRLTNKPALASVGSELLRAEVLAQTLTQGLKLSVRRVRPDGTSFSFPSGHAAGTFASATVLQRRYGWKVGVPAYAAALYVAANRLAESKHFLSDVTFGATVGIIAGRTVAIGPRRAKFMLVPSATPGGVGINFVKQ